MAGALGLPFAPKLAAKKSSPMSRTETTSFLSFSSKMASPYSSASPGNFSLNQLAGVRPFCPGDSAGGTNSDASRQRVLLVVQSYLPAVVRSGFVANQRNRLLAGDRGYGQFLFALAVPSLEGRWRLWTHNLRPHHHCQAGSQPCGLTMASNRFCPRISRHARM